MLKESHGATRHSVRIVAIAACALLALIAFVQAPRANAATVGTFQTLANSPFAMTGVTVDPTTNLVYGQEYEGTGFERYNPATNAWTALANAPINDANDAGAAYLNGKIYVVYPENSGMAVYDIASNTWTTTANPLGHDTGVIAAAGGLLYLVGTADSPTPSGQTFVSYNPATGVTTPLASAPAFTDVSDPSDCAGYGFSAWGGLVPYGGKLYGDEGNACNGFAVYDIASNTWTEPPQNPLPAVGTDNNGPTLGAAIDPVSGTYFDYGTYDSDPGNLFSYSIAGNTWAAPITLPPGEVDDGGMAYVPTPGLQGIYAVQGEDGDGFVRYVTSPPVDLSLTKSASASKVNVGKKFTYTLHVSNAGPGNAPSTTVVDPLPADVTFVSATASQGTCAGTSTVICTLGTVASGGSATVTIKVKAAHAGSAVNTASVASAYLDTNQANNTASATVKIALALKLKLSRHTGHAGQQLCISFKASAGGKKVKGAKVSLAHHSARTNRKGKARLCVTFAKKGVYHAHVSKKGYARGSAAVHIKA